MILFKRYRDEDEASFILRLRRAWDAKRDELHEDYHPEVVDQPSLRDIYNREYGTNFQSSIHVRTKMGIFRARESQMNLIPEDYKMKVIEQDIIREKRNALRLEARADRIETEIQDAVARTYKSKINIPRVMLDYADSEAHIAVVSDVHFGAEHDNYVSKYNVAIAKERMAQYARFIVQDAKRAKASEIVVLNTGDLIEGMIHVGTRIQAELDVVEQTMQLSEVLVQFLSYIIANTNVPIRYGSVLDNHSRVHANKSQAIEKESFGKIIEWYVRSRFEEGQLDFIENRVDDNIGYVEVKGKKIAYVHGHLDTVAKSKDRISGLIGTLIDILIISHRHHIATIDGVYQSGSMKGVDEYAFNFRASDAPSQMILAIQDGELPYIRRTDVYFDVEYADRYKRLTEKI